MENTIPMSITLHFMSLTINGGPCDNCGKRTECAKIKAIRLNSLTLCKSCGKTLIYLLKQNRSGIIEGDYFPTHPLVLTKIEATCNNCGFWRECTKIEPIMFNSNTLCISECEDKLIWKLNENFEELVYVD